MPTGSLLPLCFRVFLLVLCLLGCAPLHPSSLREVDEGDPDALQVDPPDGEQVCTGACSSTPGSVRQQIPREYFPSTQTESREEQPGAVVMCKDGHYRPPNSCFFKRILVDAHGGISMPAHGAKPPTLSGGSVFDTWNIHKFIPTHDEQRKCEILSGPVVAFTFYYHYGSGNYYHFVYDTLIPLFALLEAQGWMLPPSAGERRLLWPTVEHGSLVGFEEGVDWSTDAFSRRREDGLPLYWHEALSSIFGDTWLIEPLTNATLERRLQRQNIEGLDFPPKFVYCVDELVAGLPKIDFGNAALISRFVGFVMKKLGLEKRHVECEGGMAEGLKHLRAGFVKRSNRRRVVNHEAIVSIMEKYIETDVLQFERLTFKEQLRLMGKYALIVGMQGAGLINSLFLPEGAHVIVLFQFNAASDSFAQLLRPRVASYRRWVNQIRKNSIHDPEKDPFHDIADTIVDEEEFELMLRSTLGEMCEG